MPREPANVSALVGPLAQALGLTWDMPVVTSLRVSTAGCDRQPMVWAESGAAFAVRAWRVVSPSTTPGETNRALMQALGLAGMPVLGLSVSAVSGDLAVMDVRLHLMKDQADALLQAVKALQLARAEPISGAL